MSQPGKTVDILIIGAGPGGLQLARYLEDTGADYHVLEAAAVPGAFFERFPRHRRLISINKCNVGSAPCNPLRYDWNSLLGEAESERFTHYTQRFFPDAEILVRYLQDFASRRKLKITYGARCETLTRSGSRFEILTQDGAVWNAERVVIATGLYRANTPKIPGIEHAELYTDYATDPARFRNARVLIIGKGNSAFETADSLNESAALVHVCSPNSLRFAWQTHFVGHLRAVNNNFLDTYQLKAQNAVLDANITAIRRVSGQYEVDLTYTHANNHQVTYRYDHIIACTGFCFDSSMFAPAAKPALCHQDRLPAMTSRFESTNVPNLYFCGTLMQARDFKKTMSGFIHGFRCNIDFLARILTTTGDLAPHSRIAVTQAAAHALKQLNHSDALFLQPGYLTDAFVGDGRDGLLDFYPAIPLDHVREGKLASGPVHTVTLEYGPQAPDPFRIERDHAPSYAARTPFLHPVIRRFESGGHEIAKLDFMEELENRFDTRTYLPALQAFLSEGLHGGTTTMTHSNIQRRIG